MEMDLSFLNKQEECIDDLVLQFFNKMVNTFAGRNPNNSVVEITSSKGQQFTIYLNRFNANTITLRTARDYTSAKIKFDEANLLLSEITEGAVSCNLLNKIMLMTEKLTTAKNPFYIEERTKMGDEWRTRLIIQYDIVMIGFFIPAK